MSRSLVALFAFLALKTVMADVPGGSLDSVFSNLDFDHWPEKEQHTHFRWSTHIGTPVLSVHQRMMVRIELQVDGAERVKHQGQGKILMLVQVRDASGRIYQNHNSLPLDNVDSAAARTESIYRQNAFVLPGEYQVSLGLLVTDTKEHAVMRKVLRVDAPRRDPLPDAWRDLPPVELLPSEDPPDSWYLPSELGRLNLKVETKRPVRIDLLVNGSSTEQPATTRVQRRGHVTIGSLIPEVKVLSEIKVNNGSFGIAIVDLERRRVIFEQSMTHDLDWAKLKEALGAGDQNKIDLKSLEHRDENAQFFLSQVQKRLPGSDDAGTLHAVIVLSGPMAFDKANLQPIHAAPSANSRVYYLRYRPMPRLTPEMSPAVESSTGLQRTRGRGGLGSSPLSLPNSGGLTMDELFGLLKPVDPRLFEVNDSVEFRKALATIFNDIARFAGN